MKDYTILCLNGGGVRGVIQLGALKAFSEQYNVEYLYTIFVKGVYGISIGSIIGSLIAFGFSMNELIDVTFEVLNIQNFLEIPRLHSFLELPNTKGLDKGEKIHESLRNIFLKKQLDFDKLKVGDSLIPLHIVASDITRCKSVIFDKHVSLWNAIRSSISLPIIFTPHTFSNRTFVDGALLCKNIIKCVPIQHRNECLALLCGNERPTDIKNLDIYDYMNHILGVETNGESEWCIQNYSKNTCILVDSATNIIEIEPDVSRLIQVGHSLFTSFLSNSLN